MLASEAGVMANLLAPKRVPVVPPVSAAPPPAPGSAALFSRARSATSTPSQRPLPQAATLERTVTHPGGAVVPKRPVYAPARAAAGIGSDATASGPPTAPRDTGAVSFYPQQLPSAGDLVVVSVTAVVEMGAYVSLLEYGNHAAMVLLSELTTERTRSITGLIREGDTDVVLVTKVDAVGGFVDLSRRRVPSKRRAACLDRYRKAKRVHGVMRRVAARLRVPLRTVYSRIAWPMYACHGHALDGLTAALADPDAALAPLKLTKPEATHLMRVVRRRLDTRRVLVHADVTVSCYGEAGIDGVKAALRAGEALSSPRAPVTVWLVRTPTYRVAVRADGAASAIALTNAVIDAIGSAIEPLHGEVQVLRHAEVVEDDGGGADGSPKGEERGSSGAGSGAGAGASAGDVSGSGSGSGDDI